MYQEVQGVVHKDIRYKKQFYQIYKFKDPTDKLKKTIKNSDEFLYNYC